MWSCYALCWHSGSSNTPSMHVDFVSIFLELFRCPIGDSRITSGSVAALPVPSIIHLKAEGELSAS